MHILFITSEMTPFAATGGLGEVSEALPVALAANGHRVTVVMPLYRPIDRSDLKMTDAFPVTLAWRRQGCALYETIHRGVRVCFLENHDYFSRPYLYGEYDDGERFAFFCAAVMALIPRLPEKPDILHLNDWQTALCLPYLSICRRYSEAWQGIATVYTIHNMEYQGIYSPDVRADLFGLSEDEGRELLDRGTLNLTAAAIRLCDRLTTVSPTYAAELSDDRISLGLGGLIRASAYKLSGIRNGIDLSAYDPQRAPDGCVPFSVDQMDGKAENKARLLNELGLPYLPHRPLVSMVTRLASHKGIDLIMETADEMLSRDILFVLLGTGEWRYEIYFTKLAERYPDRVRALIGFDRSLSKRIYAASDFFLMPSRSEACGVAQMIASRYGTLPIVHETGGLRDTVTPCDLMRGEGDGFGFTPFTAEAFRSVFHYAIDLYDNRPDVIAWLRANAMRRDRSWDASAREYEHVYEQAKNGG